MKTKRFFVKGCFFALIFALIFNVRGFAFVCAALDEEYRLPIIMYHNVLKSIKGEYVVSPSQLESDFVFIKENGYTPIFISELVDFVQTGKPLPAKPIMITFDDGNKSVFLNAFELIKKYQIKVVVSVVGAYTDSNYDEKDELKRECYAYLNYEHIKEMSQSGLVEFQNHSYDMHCLSPRRGVCIKRGENVDEYKNVLERDLARLQQRMSERAGIECVAVAFPFGSYGKPTLEVVRQMGFKAALTCTEGVNVIDKNSDLFLLKRFNRSPKYTTKQFFARLK